MPNYLLAAYDMPTIRSIVTETKQELSEMYIINTENLLRYKAMSIHPIVRTKVKNCTSPTKTDIPVGADYGLYRILTQIAVQIICLTPQQ